MQKKPKSPSAVFQDSLHVIIEATKIGLWDWHFPSGKVIYSKEWEHILGYDEGELAQNVSVWENAVLPEDLVIAEKAISDYIAGKTNTYEAEFRVVCKDGSIIWTQDKGTFTQWDDMGKPVRLVGVLQNIDRLKQAEKNLKEKSEQLDFVAKLSGLGTWDWNLAAGRILFNDEYLHMLGYRQEEICGTIEEWESWNHPADLERSTRQLTDYLSGKSEIYSCEIRMRHKDGHYIWTLDTGRISEWDENGKPLRLLGGHLNIDKLKRAEEKLQEALVKIETYNQGLQIEIEKGVKNLAQMQKNAQVMFDANPHVSIIINDKFQIVDGNPAALQFFGFSDKQEFLQNIDVVYEAAYPSVNPDGSSAIPLRDRLAYAAQHGYCEFESNIEFQGETIPINSTYKRIAYNDSFAIAAYQLDLRILKKAQDDLEKQDALLHAVNTVASLLISAEYADFDDTLSTCLQVLGNSVHVSRVCVWQNRSQNNSPEAIPISHWCSEAACGKDSGALSALYQEFIPRWEATLRQNHCINTTAGSLPPEEQALLARFGICSILIVPIFIQAQFWGFIGFADFERERLFSQAEENILQSAGLIIGAALLRNETNHSLVLAKEEALSSAKAKSLFLANMSHEIRTPMNAIFGMTTIARGLNADERVADCLKKIDAASRHLRGIINDVLDMSRIEAEKFDLNTDTILLQDFVDNIRNLTEARAREKNQSYRTHLMPDVPYSIVCDDLRLAQVITNLLSNAVKFTPENGQICLDISVHKQDNCPDQLQFVVEDTGIGIEQEKLPMLFSAFEQLDRGINKRFGGTGLGLAISKRIVEMMQGSISVESEPGRGSRFTLRIPLVEGTLTPKIAAKRIAQNVQHDFSGKHLLLVEDIEINREIVLALLEGTHVTVDCAENGAIALEKFRDEPYKYDAIFMDIHMPVMDGYEATYQLRAMAHDWAQKIPIIAMTANAFAEDIANCVAAGMNDHIAKPIDFNEVLEKLSFYMR